MLILNIIYYIKLYDKLNILLLKSIINFKDGFYSRFSCLISKSGFFRCQYILSIINYNYLIVIISQIDTCDIVLYDRCFRKITSFFWFICLMID